MSTPNQASQQESRKLLIDATITAIAEYGLFKLTLAKISSIAGMTAGSINFHFDSKESLLLETLNFVSDEFDEIIAEALEQGGSKPAERLTALIDASLVQEVTEHRKMAVWHAFDSESRANEDYQRICNASDRKYYKIVLSLCEQIIRQKSKESEISARAVASGIIGLINELWKEILFEGENYDREDARQVCMGFLASIFPWCFDMPILDDSSRTSTINGPVSIVKASKADIEKTSTLFDLYRQFYQQNPDLPLAKKYIGDKIKTDSSVIYLALDADKKAIGFCQLYPSYCSVSVSPIWILYDLYVDSAARKNGVAKLLMNQALSLAKETGASRIDLETAIENTQAQVLYESLGYMRDNEFYKYSLEL